jgi:RNase P subunit RPR2
MSIKVITNKHPSVIKRVVCRNCAAELEYTPSDTREYSRKDYTGDSSAYTVLDCPACKKEICLKVT